MNALLEIIYSGLAFVCIAVGLENLAQNPVYMGAASQSLVHKNNWAAADKAVDGHTLEEDGKDYCSFTRSNKSKTAWWKLPLLQKSNVAYLLLFLRQTTINRHTGFSVFVFNEPSYIPPFTGGYRVFQQDPSSCPNHVMNVTVNRVIKGIALYNSKTPPLVTGCAGYEPSYATIEICEVMVMGCHFQHYGDNCAPCSEKCLNQECDAFNGSCIYGCSNNLLKPPHCCVDYKYGPSCAFDCGHCKDGKPCSKTNGTCFDGCEAGWTGILCLKISSSAGDADEDCSKTSSVIISVISTLVFVAIITVMVIIVYKKRLSRTMQSGKNQPNEDRKEFDENPKFYNQVGIKNDCQTYDDINL
ncbi:uncharacterized protein LOC134239388 [Saccostrea cucullata]|uniref:uncharacterized protein LOC134239388 n=1 Tax=Saccostrea cuccullata TaxID=36930 RepID=UPI002ED34D16